MKKESATVDLALVKQEFDNAENQEVRDALTRIFGALNYRTFRDVKTYEDALKVLGEEKLCFPVLPEIGDDVKSIGHRIAIANRAFIKLATIRAAILKVEGVKECNDEGYMYYPWFALWTKEEMEKLSDEEKKDIFPIPEKLLLGAGNAYAGSGAGFGFTGTFHRCSNTAADYAVLLCLPKREMAEYFGQQFIDIWCDYLNA